MMQGLEPSQMAAKWLFLPLDLSLFSWSKECQPEETSVRYAAVSHLHRSNAVFSQGQSGGRLHLGLLVAIAKHCVQAVLARLAWLLIRTVTEVWVAGLKGSRFDPYLCSGMCHLLCWALGLAVNVQNISNAKTFLMLKVWRNESS